MGKRNKARAARRNEARREARALAAVSTKAANAPAEKISDRDGLEWLVAKGRLKGSRLRAGRWLRKIGRDAASDGQPPLRSILDDRVGGGGGGEPPALIRTDAAMKLRYVRACFGAGPGQPEGFRRMLELLDGVCIGGRTIIEMAGQDDRKAIALEAELGIALDLVSLAQAQQEAAEKTA
ncbi:MAG TPA: hypothetical protein PKA65_12170 [Solirubrobacterales bacterium]|nr:hypothetical protein [Solirubrobacterales bacterium]